MKLDFPITFIIQFPLSITSYNRCLAPSNFWVFFLMLFTKCADNFLFSLVVLTRYDIVDSKHMANAISGDSDEAGKVIVTKFPKIWAVEGVDMVFHMSWCFVDAICWFFCLGNYICECSSLLPILHLRAMELLLVVGPRRTMKYRTL